MNDHVNQTTLVLDTSSPDENLQFSTPGMITRTACLYHSTVVNHTSGLPALLSETLLYKVRNLRKHPPGQREGPNSLVLLVLTDLTSGKLTWVRSKSAIDIDGLRMKNCDFLLVGDRLPKNTRTKRALKKYATHEPRAKQ